MVDIDIIKILSLSLSLSLSLTHTHTHTHTLSLSLSTCFATTRTKEGSLAKNEIIICDLRLRRRRSPTVISACFVSDSTRAKAPTQSSSSLLKKGVYSFLVLRITLAILLLILFLA